LVIGCELAPLALGEGQVQAIIDSAARLRGDFNGPRQQRFIRLHDRRRCEDVGKQKAGLPYRDKFLPLGLRQRAGTFGWKNRRGD
jgi:hypothetical protein